LVGRLVGWLVGWLGGWLANRSGVGSARTPATDQPTNQPTNQSASLSPTAHGHQLCVLTVEATSRYGYCYNTYGTLGFEGTALDWGTMIVHMLLSTSSLIFHVLKTRILRYAPISFPHVRRLSGLKRHFIAHESAIEPFSRLGVSSWVATVWSDTRL
jgi:hypothetical protein